jgi:hypothetical protein
MYSILTLNLRPVTSAILNLDMLNLVQRYTINVPIQNACEMLT